MSFQELAQEMVDLHTQHYSEMTQMARELGTGGETIILHLLFCARQEVYAEDLARQTGLSAGRVASILKKLEERGIITRTRCEDNRRKYRIDLTETGREAARESERLLLESHEKILRELGEPDARDFLRLTSKLCAIYRHRQEG